MHNEFFMKKDIYGDKWKISSLLIYQNYVSWIAILRHISYLILDN